MNVITISRIQGQMFLLLLISLLLLGSDSVMSYQWLERLTVTPAWQEKWLWIVPLLAPFLYYRLISAVSQRRVLSIVSDAVRHTWYCSGKCSVIVFNGPLCWAAQVLHIQANRSFWYLQFTSYLCLTHTSHSHFNDFGPTPLQLFSFNFRARSLIFCLVNIMQFKFLALSIYMIP